MKYLFSTNITKSTEYFKLFFENFLKKMISAILLSIQGLRVYHTFFEKKL
jgi:hypothetical protein